MDAFMILLEQVALFAIYLFAGILLVKTKVLDEPGLAPISKFVLKLALPVMIFINTINGVTRGEFFATLPILALTALMYFLLYMLAAALAKLFGLKGNRRQVYRAVTMFGNIGFMGIPIISSLYPEHGMLYIALFTVVDQLILWTVGVKLTTPEVQGKNSFEPKKMINPATVAVLSAVLFILCGLQLPGVLNTACSKIGAASTPLAMIYLGGVFACMDMKKYICQMEFYAAIVLKMMLFPLLFFLFLGVMPVTEEIRMTMALLSAMPSMSSIVMMAKASGSDGEYAVGSIFVTTVFSLGTLPLLIFILNFLSSM